MQLLQSAVMFCLLNVNIFPRTLLSNIYSLLLLLLLYYYYYYYCYYYCSDACRTSAPNTVAAPCKPCIVICRFHSGIGR